MKILLYLLIASITIKKLFSQSDSLKVRLKDYHSAQITQIKTKNDQKYLVTGDASGKIILSNTKDFTPVKTLVKPNGIPIKKIRLTNNDSIILYTQNYQTKDKKVDSLYFLDHNYETFNRVEILGNAFFEDQDDVFLSYISSKNDKGILVLDKSLNLVEAIELPKKISFGFDVEKAFYDKESRKILYSEIRFDNSKRLVLRDLKTKTDLKVLEINEDYVILSLFKSNGTYMALINNKIKNELYICDLSKKFDVKNPISNDLGNGHNFIAKNTSVNVRIKSNGFIDIIICTQSATSTTIHIQCKEGKFSREIFTNFKQGFSSCFIGNKVLIAYNIQSNDYNTTSNLFGYDLKTKSKKDIKNQFKGEFFKAHFFDDNSWVTYGLDNKYETAIKYFSSGTFENRFDTFSLKNYLEVHFDLMVSSRDIEIKKETQNIYFQAWMKKDAGNPYIKKVFKYNLKEDKLYKVFPDDDKKFSDNAAYRKLYSIIDANDKTDRVLMSEKTYYNRGHVVPQEFFLLENDKIKKLDGQYKFGRFSGNGDYLVTINDKNILDILKVPSFEKISSKKLESGSYDVKNLGNLFYITNSFSTIYVNKCSKETVMITIHENNEVSYVISDCSILIDVDIHENKSIFVLEGRGIVRQSGNTQANNLKTYPLFQFPVSEFPQNVSFNKDGTKFMTSLNNGKIKVYDFETLEKLSESIHPNIESHVFTDLKGHFFSNIDPKSFLVVEQGYKFNSNFTNIDSTLFRPDEILKAYGKPNEEYLKTLKKAVSLRNQYKKEDLTTVKEVEDIPYQKPNLYLLTIGVSEYKDSNYNLTFADKDAIDIIDEYTDLNNEAKAFLQKKFFSHRYRVIQNKENQIKSSGSINKYQSGYGGLHKCIPIEKEGKKWIESKDGKVWNLWDFTKREVKPIKFEGIIDQNLVFINPDSPNSFFYVGKDDKILYEYNFEEFCTREVKVAYDTKFWSRFYKNIKPIKDNKWVYLKDVFSSLQKDTHIYRSNLSNLCDQDSILIDIDTYKESLLDSQTIKCNFYAPQLKAVSSNGNHILYSASTSSLKEDVLFYVKYANESIPVRLKVACKTLDTFSISDDGERIIRHHQYPKNIIQEYNSKGNLLNEISLDSFEGVSIFGAKIKLLKEEKPIVDESMLMFKKNYKNPVSFVKIYSKYLINEKVTSSNVKQQISNFINNAEEKDQVILFISGHGVLGKNNNYYFAPYDMDFSDIECKGLSLKSIVEILNKTKSQKKLLLLDTCHSGKTFDIENNDDSTVYEIGKDTKGRISKSLKKADFKLSNILNLFDNFYSKSDISIISASSGSNVAYENNKLQNGAFTAAFLKILKENNSFRSFNQKEYIDLSSDFTEELLKKVMILTNGKQLPDIKELNIKVDIKIW